MSTGDYWTCDACRVSVYVDMTCHECGKEQTVEETKS